ACFTNGHEVPNHVGMGDGYRTACFNLCLEFRYYRTVRGEYVSEPHGNQSHRVLAGATAGDFVIERLTIDSRQAVGGAEHRYRFDRLVSRNHHHSARTGCRRRIGDIYRAENVGLNAFIPVLLEHRHMLERGCMKDNVRSEVPDEVHDTSSVTNVGNATSNLCLTLFVLQRFDDGV